MNKQIGIVFKKEMRDMIRDRRALMAAFSFAFVGPLLILVIGLLVQEDSDPYFKPTVAVAGAEYAPGLVAHLVNSDYKIKEVEAPEDTPDVLPAGTRALLVIDPEFQDQLEKGAPAKLDLIYAATSPGKVGQARAIRRVVEEYASHIATARLTMRGIPATLLGPIEVRGMDMAQESLQVQLFGDLMVLLLIIAPFAASMSVAIDTLAGERERQSLQPLLAQPVSGWSLVLGKWLMVTSFGVVGTLLASTTYFLTLELIPIENMPIAMHINPKTFLLTLLQMVPFAMLVASLQMFVSIRVKSFKEGQTYMSLLMMAPMFIGYVKVYGSDKLPDFVLALPILSHMDSMAELLFNNSIAWTPLLLSIVVSIAGLAGFLVLTARQVENERLLDGA